MALPQFTMLCMVAETYRLTHEEITLFLLVLFTCKNTHKDRIDDLVFEFCCIIRNE